MIAPMEKSTSPSAYELALEAALTELEEVKSKADSIGSELARTEARASELKLLINSLMPLVSNGRRTQYATRLLIAPSSTITSGRASETYGNVVNLFAQSPDQKEWKASAVQAALHDAGVNAEPKAVYNVLNYLAKKGQIRRISRGRYLIVDYGIALHTSDDFEEVDSSMRGRT